MTTLPAPPAPAPAGGGPTFSVVINTLNRANLLDDAIRGVFQLDYPLFELIVVNGPSVDDTEAVLARWAGQIKHLHCAEPNLSMSRNIGIAAATADIVAFLDDDAVPHPLWLANLARHYANQSVGGVGGFTVDNTGVRWQVRKTACDRFGNAHYIEDFFDERALNFPGTPFYPSLLGTNSSFRRSALQQIGGFDHTFAYLLDETDVCLRLVDAGWKVIYEPSAMIFHQFAESHVRSATRKPRTLYPSVVSKTYFINRHGKDEGYAKVGQAVEAYQDELYRANAWLEEHGEVSPNHRASLDQDVTLGTAVGVKAAYAALLAEKPGGDLPIAETAEAFQATPRSQRIRIALVSQGIPPDNEAGIARWTSLLAHGLIKEGVDVHIVSRATREPSRRFRDGIWYHSVVSNPSGAAPIAAKYDVPKNGVADWLSAIMKELEFIKTFGLDLVSFPIWDVEALPVIDDPDIATVLSLHTTYKLARPFKPEWNTRIIYGRAFVDRMIAAEKIALQTSPTVLANSNAVVREMEEGYGCDIADRCRVIPHGTTDILADNGLTPADKLARQRTNAPLRVLFVGRFEPRKGYDLALKVAAIFDGQRGIRFDFAGGQIDDSMQAAASKSLGIDPARIRNLIFHGEVDRAGLDHLYTESDVVLMPSRFESFGLVAIEAMSAASPVLAMAIGGLTEIIEDGQSGRLFSPENSYVDGSVATLNHLMANRDELARMSAAAYARFKDRFSVAAMARDVADLYRNAIAAKRSKS